MARTRPDPEHERALAENRARRWAALDRSVGRVARQNLTRDVEFVYRRLHALGELPAGATLGGVRESLRRQPFLSALRGLPVLGRAQRGAAARETVFSSIVTGRYPREHNYACRLFQFDVVRVPSVKVSKGVLVSAGPARNVVTGICVGSRYAFAAIVPNDDTSGTHAREKTVLRAFRAIYNEIEAAFRERQRVEADRARGGYYTAAAHAARCDARRAERMLLASGRAPFQRRTADETIADLDALPIVHGGPGLLVVGRDASGERTFAEETANAAVSDRPLIRALGAHGGARYSWLDDLAELTLSAGGAAGAGRAEVRAAWEQTHAHLTFMFDAGDFGATRATIDTERDAASLERVRWCVVNKSQLSRLSMQIIERFHRTLRAMMSIYYYAYAPSDEPEEPEEPKERREPPPSLGAALKRAVETYNHTRHGTTRHRPVDLWHNWGTTTCACASCAAAAAAAAPSRPDRPDRPVLRPAERYSAQTPRFASLDGFPVGSYVEVTEGPKGMLAGKKVVKRIGGLRVIAHNHCTLELERMVPDDDDDDDDDDDEADEAAGLGQAQGAGAAGLGQGGELLRVHGIGPRVVARLSALGVTTIAGLRASPAGLDKLPPAARSALPYTEELQQKVPAAETRGHVALLGVALRAAGASGVQAAGSFRRGKPLSGDIDVLVTAATAERASAAIRGAMAALAPYVLVNFTPGGVVKWQGIVRLGAGLPARRLDMHGVGADEEAFALMYFTGSREFNIMLRHRAKARGMRLTERGLFANDGRSLPAATETEVFALLNTPFVAPNNREAAAGAALALGLGAAAAPAGRAAFVANKMPRENRVWVRESGTWQLRSTWRLSPVPPWMCRRVSVPVVHAKRRLPGPRGDAVEMTNERNSIVEQEANRRWAVRSTEGLRSEARTARVRSAGPVAFRAPALSPRQKLVKSRSKSLLKARGREGREDRRALEAEAEQARIEGAVRRIMDAHAQKQSRDDVEDPGAPMRLISPRSARRYGAEDPMGLW